ncbi:MAG: PrsW family intramembrane metalloprotease [Thermodesulfobacteriota bacterium]
MQKELFIALSFIIGLFCVKYLSTFDKHEKEPFGKMFAVACWGGAWSIIVSFILYGLLRKLGINDLQNSFGALLVIGPVEEFAKLLALFSSYFIIREEMNEPTDGIIYMACVALGFSLIENYFYATRSVGSDHLLLVRLFISTPMHIAFSVFMGLAFYVWKRYAKTLSIFIIPFLYASLVHGLYDLVIFNGLTLIVLLLVVKGSYYFTLSLLSYTTAQSPHRLPLEKIIESEIKPSKEKGLRCLNCCSTNPKETFKLKNILIQKCDTCEYFVTTKKGIFQIFHYFAATFKKLDKNYSTPFVTGHKYSTLYSNNYVSDKDKLAFFKLKELNETIEEVNTSIIEKMGAKRWFPKSISAPETPSEPIDYEKVIIKTGVAAWKWLIYPFSSDRNNKINIPEQPGPSWNWGAFLIPELWFLYHEIWGVFFFVTAFYMSLTYASIHGFFNIFGQGMLVVLLIVRLISGRIGNNIYFFRHGRWPIASYNQLK